MLTAVSGGRGTNAFCCCATRARSADNVLLTTLSPRDIRIVIETNDVVDRAWGAAKSLSHSSTVFLKNYTKISKYGK